MESATAYPEPQPLRSIPISVPDRRLAVELDAPLAAGAVPITGDVEAGGEILALGVAGHVDLISDDDIVGIDISGDEIADLETRQVERADVLDFLRGGPEPLRIDADIVPLEEGREGVGPMVGDRLPDCIFLRGERARRWPGLGRGGRGGEDEEGEY